MIGGALSGNMRAFTGGASVLVGGMIGGVTSIEGMAISYAGYEALEKAADLDQARVLMKNKGVTDDKIAEVEKTAFAKPSDRRARRSYHEDDGGHRHSGKQGSDRKHRD
jgi:hypothetical protein